MFPLAALFSILFSGPARAQEANPHDYSRITQVPRAEIDSWLKQEAATSGGDWNTGRYHLFIGFSTGHFGQDPVHGIAMRRLAFSLMNNSLTVGDRVTPIGWELSTWEVGPTVNLTSDPVSRAEFVDRVPYAPQSGSHGGHDIERTLFETITKAVPADEAGSAIILLLTNSNASQSPTGERAELFGANNPRLTEALRKGRYRVPPVRKEFRLFAGTQPVTVAVTALFPQKLVSLPGAPVGPRYPTFARETWQPSADRPPPGEPLPNPERTAKPAAPPVSAPSRQGIPGWGWAVAGVVLVLAAAAYFLTRRPTASPGAPLAAVKPKTTVTHGTPIPGSVAVQIGQSAQTLQPLSTGSKWTLQLDDTGAVGLVESGADAPAPTNPAVKPATPLAQLAFDEKRNLLINAEAGAQFTDLKGSDPSGLDSRALSIPPGKTAICRIVPAGSTAKTRFEVTYNLHTAPGAKQT